MLYKFGLRKVENFLDALHCIRFQTDRNNLKRLSQKQIKEKYIKLINNDKDGKYKSVNIDREIIDPDTDLLSFLIERGSHFENWQLDILSIVRDESRYFIPQMKTKIMNITIDYQKRISFL